MRPNTAGILKSLLLLLVLSLLYSCSPEKKLAKSFVGEDIKRYALLLGPEKVYKTSLKTEIFDTIDVDGEAARDSVLMANSVFLQHIDDVLFIKNFMTGFEKELELFNFDVYDESQTGDFLEVDSNAYVIYVAQLELEESFFPFKDETRYMDAYYYHEHLLNAASVYSWFEISEVNQKRKRNVYFAEDAVVDEVDGEFTSTFLVGR